jgi:hypothetical protein
MDPTQVTLETYSALKLGLDILGVGVPYPAGATDVSLFP